MNYSPNDLRKCIINMAYSGQSVHIGCAFSMVEITHALFSKFFNVNAFKAKDPDRNLLCVSKGHGVMAFYAALAHEGIIAKKDIENYFKDGTELTGLADSHVPGIEISGGSLGQGITIATGLALGKKIDASPAKVLCVIGDGEMNEGSCWEALSIASHQKLSNLIVIVDANGFQAMGTTKEILNCSSLAKKFESFDFEVLECNGHSLLDLDNALSMFANSKDPRPKALIANTVKGKGVSFMENNNIWHYSRLNAELYEKAMGELLK